MTTYTSPTHVFSIEDLTATYSGVQYPALPGMLDTAGTTVEPYTDRDGNILYAIDSEFGFYIDDFIGALEKVLDGDFAEGFAGNAFDDEGNQIGIALRDAETDVFLSGAPFGTWSLGLGGNTVKASTEHYETMASVLSDQEYPGDPGAIGPLDDDLKMLDIRPSEVTPGTFDIGPLNNAYIHELIQALQAAMDSADPGLDTVLSDIDFDRDGVLDTYRITKTTVNFDDDGDGIADPIVVGAVDVDNDGTIDIVDSFLNGYGGDADIVDLLEPNESSVTYNIAYGQDYSVTLKDDGKLLYRWGEAVKRPNDIRLEVDMPLPEEWTRDANNNSIMDGLEGSGFTITRAELVITHDITNNPNDQVRPEDYENEAAIGRLPSFYIVKDPDDPTKLLWVSPLDSFDGTGEPLPSYFILDADGNVDLAAGGTAVYDPDDVLVGYRNEDGGGNPVGTVFRSDALAEMNAAAGLDFMTEDLEHGFTEAWYTTTDREPFEWSYDLFPTDPYKNVFESFRSPDDAEDAGFTEDALVSGPRWRLTPNKFGQDLPGLEIPLEENSEPPYTRDNIKYDTGEVITTTLNLLDWEGDSPLASSLGWMSIDIATLDENADGLIDEGWSMVNGSLGAGDAVPTDPILTAVTPNGVTLESSFFDVAVYMKGDRQDDSIIYDMELIIEYESDAGDVIGAVQSVGGVNHQTQTVSYQGGTTFDNPVVFASLASRVGWDMVTVEFTDISATGASFYLDEPEGYDGTHAAEEVTLVTFEEGVWELADGSLLQVGTTNFAAGATDAFHRVTFEQAFDEAPILLLQIQSDNGGEWEIVRAQNIGADGFDFAIEEREAADGWHTSEVVGWAALDASAADGVIDWGGIGSQAFSTGDTVSHEIAPFALDAAVGADPLVAAFLASYNGADTANVRTTGVTFDGLVASANFKIDEETSLDAELEHAFEDVHGFAFEQAGLLTGMEYVDPLLIT
ncbi:MAG: hypothetical protein HOY44_08560 [Maritimibacter sp.]|uniref:hypothetical protein n=1 Tax=Maritimibacter sp. TaxID=2003363 RepID=UPI001D767E8B|nr:hypothetical protein [Maritimibacter sp.]MBL6427561.1 hypothetical protein [Maritimibacter sp.]